MLLVILVFLFVISDGSLGETVGGHFHPSPVPYSLLPPLVLEKSANFCHFLWQPQSSKAVAKILISVLGI